MFECHDCFALWMTSFFGAPFIHVLITIIKYNTDHLTVQRLEGEQNTIDRHEVYPFQSYLEIHSQVNL